MKSRAATSLGTIGFMAGAVLFALLAGMFLSKLLGSTYSRDPVRPVVVAARPIAAGQPMRKEDLRIALWPVSSVPDGAFRAVDEVLRASRVPLIPMVRGEAVLRSHLSQPNAGIGIAPLIDRNHRAMSIRTDDPVTLARLIYPGARVDLISTIREIGANGKAVTTSQTVIQNAKVLAVGEDIDPLSSSRRDKTKKSEGAMSMSSDSDGREARGVVTLLVTLEQAEALSLASREGKLDIVLRGPRDEGTVPTSGVTAGRLLGGEQRVALKESAGLQVSLSEPGSAHRPARTKGAARRKAVVRAGAPSAGGDSGGGGGGVVIFRGSAR